MFSNSISNRSSLIDLPIIEFLLNKKFSQSKLKFTKCNGCLTCNVNGTNRSIFPIRNPSKHVRSRNFTLFIDKNKLNCFNNASYIFIDETKNTMYIVDGIVLLNYVLSHSDKLKQIGDSTTAWLLLPKSDIASLANSDYIIQYGHKVAKLFENSRDESLYTNLN